jgi:phospholipase/carboxylesterase
MSPHTSQPVETRGARLDNARAAAILVHGRGGTAQGMLALGRELAEPGVAYLAPQAAENSWYPYSFLSPLEFNAPELRSATAVMDSLVQRIISAGIPASRILLLGFSQGACLTLEYSARRALRYGGIAALSGGLIGPDGTPRDYPGSFDGTPVFIGCGDDDPYIPQARVAETAEVFKRLDATVTVKQYPDLAHTVNADEMNHIRTMLHRILDSEVHPA